MEWPSETLYIGCTALGGAVLSLQLLLLLFGGDGDADGLEDGSDGMSFLSIRSFASFLTLFGLFGWWGSVAEWGPARTLATAAVAGLLMMVAVGWLLASFRKLQSTGNIDPTNAVGTTVRVYLRVPAENSGKGKVTVAIQGRSRQFEAVTKGAELPTGSDARIVGMTTQDTFEVVPLNQGGES
jgi:hypothetical protein